MASFFWANRLLPVQLHERAQAEINVFFAVWGLAAIAGLAWPRRRMWLAQLGIAAFLFGAIPLLNAATTATHLGVTIPAGLWRVAGFDLACLALGAVFGLSAWWLARKDSRQAARKQAGQPGHPLADAGAAP